MHQSPGFKLFDAYKKLMPVSDLDFRCLEEDHSRDRCQICRDVKPKMKKDREIRLTHLLMEAALCPASEPPHLEHVPSTFASVRSAPPALADS